MSAALSRQWCRCSLCESQQPDSSCIEDQKVEATDQERGPHRSQEQARILKEVGTLQAALIFVGKPRQASAAAIQCLAVFGLYHDLQLTPPKVKDCAAQNDPESSSVRTNCILKPSNRTAGTTERLTGKSKKPFSKSTRDLANFPASMGRNQRTRN